MVIDQKSMSLLQSVKVFLVYCLQKSLKVIAYSLFFSIPSFALRPMVAFLLPRDLLPSSLSASKLSKLIRDKFKDQETNGRSLYFVEIGGNDGLTQSNTLLLELDKSHVWRGLLVEPSQKACSRARRVRGSMTTIIRGAGVSFDYSDSHVDMLDYDLTSFSPTLESDFDRSGGFLDASRRWSRQISSGRTYQAPAITLSTALERAGAPNSIDLLTIDVEGSELEILRGVDFSKYRFDMIVVESRDHSRISKYLAEFGYKMEMAVGGDFIFSFAGEGQL